MLKKSKNRKNFLQIVGLIACLFLLNLLSTAPHLIENYYSNGLYPIWAVSFRALFGWLPFAMGDVLYIVIVGFILYSIFKGLKSIIKAPVKGPALLSAFKSAFIFCISLFIWFKIGWGLNYDRPPINQTLGIQDSLYTEAQLTALAELLIHKIKELDSAQVMAERTDNHTILAKRAVADYQLFSKTHPSFKYSLRSIKPALSSGLLSKFAVEGYFNPFTGEANINRAMPVVSQSFTYAHEIAHQMGVAKEDEANLLAYVSGIHSSNLSTRYAAYYGGLTYVLFEIYGANPEKFNALYDTCPSIFKADMQEEQKFWKKHRSALFGYMNTVLDAYLKFNNQSSGIRSYSAVVVWIYNYHKKALST